VAREEGTEGIGITVNVPLEQLRIRWLGVVVS
jgi:hypothetical protein